MDKAALTGAPEEGSNYKQDKPCICPKEPQQPQQPPQQPGSGKPEEPQDSYPSCPLCNGSTPTPKPPYYYYQPQPYLPTTPDDST